MQVNELKKIFEVSSILGKGFSPITEYTYVKNNVIKATNMEAFIEMKLDEPLPFTGCVLTDKMSKFLTSMNKEADLNFIVNKNTLDIHYGKKNKITIPMEDLKDFPDSPFLLPPPRTRTRRPYSRDCREASQQTTGTPPPLAPG